jgi:hypothetical protein
LIFLVAEKGSPAVDGASSTAGLQTWRQVWSEKQIWSEISEAGVGADHGGERQGDEDGPDDFEREHLNSPCLY